MALLIIYLILYLFIYLDLTLQVLRNLYVLKKKEKKNMLRQLPWAAFEPENYNKNVLIQTMPSMPCHLNNFSVDIHPYICTTCINSLELYPVFTNMQYIYVSKS